MVLLKVLQSSEQASFEGIRMSSDQFVNRCMPGHHDLLRDASKFIPLARTRTRTVRSAVDMSAYARMVADSGA